jgi:hypothetical protein
VSVASCTATFVATALPPLLLTWRCSGCRRVVAKLEYDGRTIIEVKHGCNTWNRLPDHADRLSVEERRL